MSVTPKGSKPPLALPPAKVPDMDARDRFGLRLNFILLEDSEQMRARWADTERFVVEAAEAVIRQVGRKTAQQLFRIALREPKKGKRSDAKENALLLEAFDRTKACGVPARNAARVAAKEMRRTLKEDVESLAAHIRRLVRDRARREMEEKEQHHALSLTLFGAVK